MAHIPMELNKIAISETGDAQVIVLRERGGNRVLPIWIGLAEALAIQRKIHGEEPARPMTHDLVVNLITKLGTRLTAVLIDRFIALPSGGTFHAKLMLTRGKETVAVDCRPSDAIALAVRCDAEIQVEEKILNEEGQDVTAIPKGPPREEEESEEIPEEEIPPEADEEEGDEDEEPEDGESDSER